MSGWCTRPQFDDDPLVDVHLKQQEDEDQLEDQHDLAQVELEGRVKLEGDDQNIQQEDNHAWSKGFQSELRQDGKVNFLRVVQQHKAGESHDEDIVEAVLRDDEQSPPKLGW